jgi:hypothetical protein
VRNGDDTLGEQPRKQDDVEISREVAEQVQILDDPDGVLPDLRDIRNALARAPWSCPVSQQAAMRRLAIAQLGSASLDAEDFRARVLDLTIRRALPSALRGAAGVNSKHATALLYAAEQCEDAGTTDAVEQARQAARSASNDIDDVSDLRDTEDEAAVEYVTHVAYVAASADAAAFAAEAVAADVVEAVTLAGYSAYYAALTTAAIDNQSAKRASSARDRIFAEYVEGIVSVLVTMQTPGSVWVH